MATVVIAANNTRVNAADANTNWANLGGGGPSPAAEAQLVYQGTNAVNRKVTTTSSRTGVEYDPGASALDMTAAANALMIAKVYVADFGDLNTTYGVEVRIGSASTAYYDYNVAGSGANRSVFDAYPAQGGYLIVAIDPNISAWREGTTGSPSLTAVDYFGAAAEFVAGGAKSENFAMDAIDVGTGLTLTRGDGGDADGVFQDFVDADEGNTSNRWGYVVTQSGVIYARGILTIGDSTGTNATEFVDNDAVVVFPDGYHSAGLFGVDCHLANASDDYTIGATLIGRGSDTTEDTRPDFVVVGTSGALLLTGTLTNFNLVTLTSGVDADGATIGCELLTQASAEIQNSRIVTASAASTSTLQDPTFGTSTGLHDTTFEQGGAGHAIELDTATTYTFTRLFFEGYGADDSTSAAVEVSASSGTVTINITEGDTPTVTSAGATVVINNTVGVKVTTLDAATTAAIQSARVLLLADSGGPAPFEDSVTLVRVTSTVTVTHTAHGLVTGDKVLIAGADQDAYNGVKTITVLTAATYTYTVSGTPTTPATGTITSTKVILDGTTDSSGEIEDAGYNYVSDQPVTGRARKGSASPFYKTAIVAGSIVAAGFDTTVFMVSDE